MSELKIPKDLQVRYQNSKNGAAHIPASEVVEYIERIAAVTAERDELRAEVESDEVAWMIENNAFTNDGYVRWLWRHDGLYFQWTTDNLEAMHFSRREDAENIAPLFKNEDIKITQHRWCAARSEAKNV